MLTFQIAYGIFAGLTMTAFASLFAVTLRNHQVRDQWWKNIDSVPMGMLTVLYAFSLWGLYKLIILLAG
jgi:membrane associated rhomboid family serine protease